MKKYLPPFLLILGFYLIVCAFNGRVEKVSEDVIVPPHGFREWNMNLWWGTKIWVDVETHIDINDSLKKILVVFILDEKDFSNYVSGDFSSINLRPGQRFFVDAYGSSWWYPYRVPRTSRSHVILDNAHFISDRGDEKEAHISISITAPYGYSEYPGAVLLSVGFASLIWQHRETFLRIEKE